MSTTPPAETLLVSHGFEESSRPVLLTSGPLASPTSGYDPVGTDRQPSTVDLRVHQSRRFALVVRVCVGISDSDSLLGTGVCSVTTGVRSLLLFSEDIPCLPRFEVQITSSSPGP